MAEKLFEDLISELTKNESENSSKILLEKFRVSAIFILFFFDALEFNNDSS